MKVLVLILYSKDPIYDKYKALWESYMNTDPRFECYFYHSDPKIGSMVEVSGNVITFKNAETRNLIWDKTVRVLKHFRPRFSEFDFICRPNTSSLFLFEKYAAYLETLPRTDLIEGKVFNHKYLYPSGCGFTMTPDVAEKILDLNLGQAIMDDVTIGWGASELKIKIKDRALHGVTEANIATYLEKLHESPIFHYRFVTSNRLQDIFHYKQFVKAFYNIDMMVPSDITATINGESVSFYKLTGLKAIVSEYFLDAERRYFYKRNVYAPRYDLIKREVHFLNLLKDFEWAPKIAATDGTTYIVTEYIGAPISPANVPRDAYAQAEKILEQLHALDITHNDIKDTEVLVKDGKLYLVDYGWSRYRGELSAGIGLFNDIKPGGDVDDSNFLKIVSKNLGAAKLPVPGAPPAAPTAAPKTSVAPTNTVIVSPPIYKDPHRKVGSQSEVPQLKETDAGLVIGGYQIFSITKEKKIMPTSKKEKYGMLRDIMSSMVGRGCETLTDIGCSSGILSYYAHQAGFKKVFALDHDSEYLALVQRCANYLDAKDAIIPQKYSFGDAFEAQDVVLMVSVIHWIFSCTAHFGSFQKIYEYLRGICKKTLLIEWIEPNDKAIGVLGHTKMNKGIQKEEYTKENFLKAFGTPVEVIHLELGTRFMYVFHFA